MKAIITIAAALFMGFAGCAHESQSRDETRPNAEWQAEEQEPGLMVTVADFALKPVDLVGKMVNGRAVVTRVISDRGFRLKVGDREVLAVVREDAPKPEMIDIEAGQTIELSGLALESSMMTQLTGTIEDDLKQAIQSEPGFIGVHWRDIRVIEAETRDDTEWELPDEDEEISPPGGFPANDWD